MKNPARSLATAVALALLVPAVASAQNVYAAIRGGAGSTPATNDGRPGFEDLSEHTAGLTMSGAVGYAWPTGLRGEGEFGVLISPVKSDAGVALGGSVKSYLSMVNLRFDASPMVIEPFKVYVGFGLGGARLSYNDEYINSSGVKMQADESRAGFACQLRTGIGYDISQRLELSVGYRYVRVSGGQIQQGQGSDRHPVNFDAIKNHSLELGFAVKF
jgi:opacity protein-like surface antigen